MGTTKDSTTVYDSNTLTTAWVLYSTVLSTEDSSIVLFSVQTAEDSTAVYNSNTLTTVWVLYFHTMLSTEDSSSALLHSANYWR